jgi:two-component system chemotaxis response regulator CheB
MKADRSDPSSIDSPETAFDVVALASSAGGLEALRVLLSSLPGDFPAAIVAVQHLDPDHRSMMAEILGRNSDLRVKQAEEGDTLHRGIVYIAPPDHHLLVNAEGTLSLSHSELVHFVRPSADLLFESVAASYGTRAIAVVLTGTGHDGDMGVQAISSTGGVVVVQDPETARFRGMPETAVETGCVNYVRHLEEIPELLQALVAGADVIKEVK